MSKARAKGTSFETALVPFLRILWPRAERTGSADFGGGDFKNTWPFLIEAKNRKELRLAEWVKQIEAATVRIFDQSGVRLYPIVAHKRRNFGAHRAYVTMPLETWVASIIEFTNLDEADRKAAYEQLFALSPSDPETLLVDPFDSTEVRMLRAVKEA